jgi:nucleoside-specific outer membrane channel protein Tsx
VNLTLARRSLLAAAVAALLTLPLAAHAQFATTNLQVLQGWYFYDPSVGENVKGGLMTTFTLNHFDDWKYGDNFAFVDMMQGQFTDGANSHLYGELHPRLFVNRLLGAKGPVLGIFKDAGLAGEFNVGQGFQAWLGGLGAELALPFPGNIGLNVYYRYTALQLPIDTTAGVIHVRDYNHTWQVSPFWNLPFSLGKVPFLFSGFVDVDGVKAGKGLKGYELMAQPELLVDVLGAAGGPKNTLLVGVEWYLHYHSANKDLGAPSNLISAPQALVQWNLH